jgi:2-polyprenyl-3-methyl-5-hydroxy-6-metoxy-1,4-benzoquinol methylase
MESAVCNLCNNTNYTVVTEVNGQRLVRCTRCSLVYVNPRRSEDEISSQYKEHYHTQRVVTSRLTTDSDIAREVASNEPRAREIIKLAGAKGKLLDIGCSAGFFIAQLKQRGWDAKGIDVSDWAAAFAREKHGVEVLKGNIDDIQVHERFDIITMYHTLEHLPSPLQTLQKVWGMLNDSGMLIVKGPNLASFDRLWFGKRWDGFADRTHLYYFTPATYRALLEKSGFVVEKIHYRYWNPLPAVRPLSLIGMVLQLKGRDCTVIARKVPKR